jgi:hypothetical protein
VALLVALAVAGPVPGVVRAQQERRLGRAASVLAGARVAVRCQSLGGAFVDGGPELGCVRWRADGHPEPWALLKRDQCRHLAAYVPSDRHRPSRDQVLMPDGYRSAGAARAGPWTSGWPTPPGSPRPPCRPRACVAGDTSAAGLACSIPFVHALAADGD